MDTVAFVDVNIIPMDADRVSKHQTVLIRDGRISEIGAVDEITIPTSAEVIQANGAYLMPGLADMHTHLSGFDPDPQHLILYLAHGVMLRGKWISRTELDQIVADFISTYEQ